MRKISILGLVLTTASAVITAILPSKSDNKLDKIAAGSLTENSGAGGGIVSSLTCATDTNGGGISDGVCNFSDDDDGEEDPDGGSETTGFYSGYNSTSLSSTNGLGQGDGGLGQDNTSETP